MRRQRDRVTHYGILAISLGLVIWGVQGYLAVDYAPAATAWALSLTGWSAAGGLLLSACATPVAGLLRWVSRAHTHAVPFAVLRRSLGICGAFFALVHAVLVFAEYLPLSAWMASLKLPFMRAGVVAMTIMVILWLTSFPAVTKRLRIRRWKHLHRLAYLACFLLFQHALLSPGASRPWVLAIGSAFAAVTALRLVPKRRQAIPT